MLNVECVCGRVTTLVSGRGVRSECVRDHCAVETMGVRGGGGDVGKEVVGSGNVTLWREGGKEGGEREREREGINYHLNASGEEKRRREGREKWQERGGVQHRRLAYLISMFVALNLRRINIQKLNQPTHQL